MGSTHHSLHDFAVLRAINNIIVAAPADNFETEKQFKLAANTNHPIYLRFGKKAMPPLKEVNDDVFEFGKGRIITEGMMWRLLLPVKLFILLCRQLKN